MVQRVKRDHEKETPPKLERMQNRKSTRRRRTPDENEAEEEEEEEEVDDDEEAEEEESPSPAKRTRSSIKLSNKPEGCDLNGPDELPGRLEYSERDNVARTEFF